METTKADEIALVLENAIISGTLLPGTVLRQEQLSEELGVSRTPVREALRQLAALGLVTFEANRGARVRSVPREELHETFVIRAELEGLAAQLATPLVTREQLKRLRLAEQRFAGATQALRERDRAELETRRLTAEWVRANDAFHDVILEASGSPLLYRMAQSVRRVFHGQIVWSGTDEVDALYTSNLSQHRAIRMALEARDPSVRDLVSGHVLDSGLLLDRVLDYAREQGRTRLLDGTNRLSDRSAVAGDP